MRSQNSRKIGKCVKSTKNQKRKQARVFISSLFICVTRTRLSNSTKKKTKFSAEAKKKTSGSLVFHWSGDPQHEHLAMDS